MKTSIRAWTALLVHEIHAISQRGNQHHILGTRLDSNYIDLEMEALRGDSSLIVTIRQAASAALPRAGGPRADAGESGAWRYGESGGEAARDEPTD